MQGGALLQRPGQRARQRDLKSVQNPGDAERKHDAGMKSAPAQRVEAKGNAGFNDATVVGGRRFGCSNRQTALP